MKTTRYKIKTIPTRKMGGYAGMNDEAAKIFRFPNCANHTILVDKSLKGDYKQRTIKHEMVEERLMETKGYSYWKAHKIALRNEKSDYKKLKEKFGIEK